MILYTSLIIWIVLIAACSRKRITHSLLAEGNCYSPSSGAALIAFAPIIFFIGLRSGGADTYAYISMFNALPKGVTAIEEILRVRESEYGFALFGTVVKTFISADYHVYLFLIALISGIFVVVTLRRFSDYFFESLILFMLTGTFTWMINGIRQFIAVAVAFWAVRFIVEKKPVKYIIVILILTTIHASAIILFPIYFIVQGRAWNKKTILVLLSGVIVIFFASRFTSILDWALEGTSYAGATEQFASDDGANPIRTVISAVPVIMAFLYRKDIDQVSEPALNIFINMSILALATSCVAMVTSGILMGRLISYFTIYSLVLLPWLVHQAPSANRKLYSFGMWVCYIFYYFYQCFYVNYYYYFSDVLGLYLK